MRLYWKPDGSAMVVEVDPAEREHLEAQFVALEARCASCGARVSGCGRCPECGATTGREGQAGPSFEIVDVSDARFSSV